MRLRIAARQCINAKKKELSNKRLKGFKKKRNRFGKNRILIRFPLIQKEIRFTSKFTVQN